MQNTTMQHLSLFHLVLVKNVQIGDTSTFMDVQFIKLTAAAAAAAGKPLFSKPPLIIEHENVNSTSL